MAGIKSWWGLLSGAVGLCVAITAVSQEQTKQPSARDDSSSKTPVVTAEQPMSFWMAQKLHFSKEILESLTMGEFDKLAETAEQMRVLGRLEGFVRRKNPDYRTQLRTFEMANQELIRQAKRGNAEGAALAFNQLSNSCVACHVLLREGVE